MTSEKSGLDSIASAGLPTSPEELRARALELLEFHAVRERLASYATFTVGRESALILEPTSDPEDVARRQRETEEARHFLDVGGALDLSGAQDVRALVERAARGGLLTGQELRGIHDALHAIRLGRNAVLRKRREHPLLSALAGRVPELRELEEEIQRATGRGGEVVDGASTTLREARAQAGLANSRLVDTLNRVIRSGAGQHVLQEPLITERNGRLVVPVKVEMRGRLPGLVHDVSDSGATLFVEPLAAISAGNRWREMRLAEAREVERVLWSLSTSVGERASEIALALDLMGHLDLTMARGRYAIFLNAQPVALDQSEHPYLRLVDARHPLLQRSVVPISLELCAPDTSRGPDTQRWTGLLITGPNAGGKTVALKTVGLLALMHQAGLQVPVAQGSVLPVFDGVYADIGDQQSIERSLSTFSSHISTVRAILGAATERSLVLLDEMGSSTDPEEGAALAKALILRFLRRDIPLVATTHQREVAAFVQETPGLMNASVELDPVTLDPTYRLTLGLPGRSYALSIAARLGLAKEVVDEARSLQAPGQRELEGLLAEVQQERHAAAQMRGEAEEVRAQVEAQQREMEAHQEELRAREAELLSGARGDLQAQAREILDRLRAAERALLVTPQSLPPESSSASFRQAEGEVRRIQRELRSQAWRPRPSDRAGWLHSLAPGDPVRVRGFPGTGQVLSSPNRQGTVEVALGALRVQVPVEHLERPGEAATLTSGANIPSVEATSGGGLKRRASRSKAGRSDASASELDLRGLRVEEALDRLEAFLDQGILQGLSKVRLIHGTGTGALRRVLRERLGQHPLVQAWTSEDDHHGDGATMVELA